MQPAAETAGYPPRPPPFCDTLLKVEPNLSGQRAGRDIVGAAERGEEVVQRIFVRQVNDSELSTPLVPVSVKHVVMAHRQVKQVTGSNAWRILVIVFRVGSRNV